MQFSGEVVGGRTALRETTGGILPRVQKNHLNLAQWALMP